MISKQLHIGLISTSFPEESDGSEAAGSFVADFAIELSKHVKVTVIAPGKATSIKIINDSLSIRKFKAPFLPLSLLKPSNPLHWNAIFSTLRNGLLSLDSCAQNEQLNFLFALWSLPSGYWAKLVAKKYKIHYATWSLGSDIWSLGKIPIVRLILKNVLQHSQKNFADGYLLSSSVENISKKACSFLPSTRSLTIEKNKILKQQGPYNIAFLGRWHPNKGADILMQSLQMLPSASWGEIKELRICGGGPLEATMHNAIQNLQGQGKAIESSGYLSKQQAINLFMWADYVLIPSRIESIPVVFSDAMKCLCPIVSMPVGDLPKLIEQYQVGHLATHVSAEAFSHAISSILKTPPKSYEANLIRTAKKFDISHAVSTFLNQIET